MNKTNQTSSDLMVQSSIGRFCKVSKGQEDKWQAESTHPQDGKHMGLLLQICQEHVVKRGHNDHEKVTPALTGRFLKSLNENTFAQRPRASQRGTTGSKLSSRTIGTDPNARRLRRPHPSAGQPASGNKRPVVIFGGGSGSENRCWAQHVHNSHSQPPTYNHFGDVKGLAGEELGVDFESDTIGWEGLGCAHVS